LDRRLIAQPPRPAQTRAIARGRAPRAGVACVARRALQQATATIVPLPIADR
jgi:hypothetical protein